MNERRKWLIALGSGALVTPLAAIAQQAPAKPRRIGYLGLASAEADAAGLAAFREGMAALGWVDGRAYVIEARYANGIAQAGPGAAAELIATRPDLLLAPGDGAALVLAQATRTIPIVFATAQDPVSSGVAASLRRPGGNATGLSTQARDLSAKRLQQFKEAIPRLTHAVLLFEPAHVGSSAQAKEFEQAAARAKVRITSIALNQPADIEPALKRGAALGTQGYLLPTGPIINLQRQMIAARLIGLKVPSMAASAAYVEAGALMSYGASGIDNFRRAAGYVDKILKGAKPGELPIQQPVTFEFVVNLKTAKAIGVTLPPIVMLQANRVIE